MITGRAAGARVLPALVAVLVAVVVGVLGGAVLLVGAAPASAHTSLVSSAPAAGEVIAQPAAQVVLVFDQEVVDLGAELAVTGPDGAPVAVQGVVVDGATATYAVDATGPAGGYTAAWRVTSADGHPVEGTLAWTAAAPGAAPEPSPDPTPPPSPEPSPEPSPDQGAASAATDEGASDGDAATSAVGSGDGVTLAWVAGALAAAGAAAVAISRLRRS